MVRGKTHVFWQVSDPLPGLPAAGWEAKQRSMSLAATDDSEQDFYQSCFASPIRTEQTKDLTTLHAQIDPFESVEVLASH